MSVLPIVRPLLGDDEVEAAERVIRSGWITQGPEVLAFEQELAAAVGAKHGAAVANCTVALELALRAVGVKAGDEVITVSHSFIATANSVVAVGAVPVFIDVREDDLGMDPNLIEAAITPRTRAILCVHQLGIPCRIQEIVAIADERGIPVVEDAACAIGSEIVVQGQRERVGRPRGAVACFSFHPRKVVTTGDGGMITTNDAAIDKRVRLLRQHAMSVSDLVRHSANDIVFEEYVEPAYNFRLTDLQAAVGRPQLRRLSDIVAERRRLADVYRKSLVDNRALIAPTDPPNTLCNWQSYPVRVREGFDQRELMRRFLEAGIATKRGVSNAHQEPAYRDRRECTRAPLPVSERLRDTTVLLPLFHGMTADEQGRVLDACTKL